MRRGSLIVELQKTGPGITNSYAYACEPRSKWSALDTAQTDALVADFLSTAHIWQRNAPE
ncbi:MAG: hypothetical protein VCA74_01175 [Deltaproteobacteria bacterium]